MAASNNAPVSVSDSVNQQSSAAESRQRAEDIMNNGGQNLSGALNQEILNLRMSQAKKTFIATKSFQHVGRTLDQFGHVTITGASGEGKTTMSLMLARDYLKKGYQVVFVEKVDAFNFNECISHRLFLIVDDIFGTVGLTTDRSHLKNLIGSIQTHLLTTKQTSGKSKSQRGAQNTQQPTTQGQQEDKKIQKDIRVVFTSKTYNFKDGVSKLQYERLSMFTEHTRVDLTSDKDHCYSDKEKIAMFQKHETMNPGVKTEGISQQDLLSLDADLFGFPLTCRLFFEFAVFSGSAKDYFKRPLFYLRIELNNLLSLNNTQTAALILMLLCEDKLDLTKLELQGRDRTMNEMFQHVTEIVPYATRQGTIMAARHFRGTFFSGGDTLRFAHSYIHDACACAMFTFNPSFVLQYCSLDFLYERLKAASTEQARASDHLHYLFVSEGYYDLLTTRFVEAMQQGHFSKTVAHPIFKNDHFQRLFIQKLRSVSSSKPVEDWIRLKERGKGILYWAIQGDCHKIVSELENIYKIRFTKSEIEEGLEGCIERDNLMLFKYILSKLEEQKHSVTLQRLLLLSGEKGSWEIAQYLLKLGGEIRATNKSGQNFLHLACKSDTAVLLKSLIEKIGSLITQKDYLSALNCIDVDGCTPVMLAAWYGSWDCFILLCIDSNLDVQDKEGNSVIHQVAWHGNKNIMQKVLTVSNINRTGMHGWTPAMYTAVEGQQRAFDLLVSNNADLTMLDDAGDSILHLACQGGNRDIVQHVLTPSNINNRGFHGWTPAMYAAVHGQLSVYELLVSKHVDLTLLDGYGDSMLHLACRGGNRDIVQHLLIPSNINSKGRYGWTPVMKAAVNGQLSVFDLLVSNNADLTLLDDYRDSILHLACRGGNTDIVQHVLTPSNINNRGYHGWTPVMYAAVHGQLSVFELLVSNNADLKLLDDASDSILHLVCWGGNRDIVQHLLTPSNINSKGRYGWTPVMKAAVHGQLSVFDLLVSNNADLTLLDDDANNILHLSCQGGNRYIVQHVLMPSNINNRGLHGWTSVMYAAVHGQLSVFELLISNNADLTLLDDAGDSILHLACRGGNRDIVQHLLIPSNINSKGRYGWTPVMKAAVNGQLIVFDLLVSNKADLTLLDDDGNSILHLSCQGGNRDIVQHVLMPSNINNRGLHGWTPVMYAAVHGQLSGFELVVSNNADQTLLDDYGNSILHLACQGGNRDIVQHVLTPSNINNRGLHGWTPVMYAAVHGQIGVFELLVSNNADITLLDDYGDGILHLTCRGGNRNMVQHLLTPSNIKSKGRYDWTPVMKAAVNGQLCAFNLLVATKADLTLLDDAGNSILHLACQGGDRDIVQHVLSPSNINNRGLHGWTSVMYASVHGQLGVFELLVSNNADLTLLDDYGNSILHLACQGGNRDIVQHVLTPSNINNRGLHGWTPVMYAAVNEQLSVFELLVSNNADLTLLDAYSDSILHLACRGGSTDIVQHVLTPSNINNRGFHGWTPFMYAAVHGQLSVFELLISNNADLTLLDDAGDSMLHLACRGGNRDIVQHLLTPSNINSKGRYGWTPVMKAAVNGQLSVFVLLVSNNADLTLLDDYGDCILHLACRGGNRDIVQHARTPSNINNRGYHGWTPVMYASVHGQLSFFELLVSNNADLTMLDDYGNSILHLACRGGNRDIVQRVLSPSSINNRGLHDWTPVMYAAVHGQLSVFELLVLNNADLTRLDDYGNSIVHLACRGGNRDIVLHVLTPSNINGRGKNGYTPLMPAAYFGHRSIIDLLIDNQADLSLLDNKGRNVIHHAQGGDQINLADYLQSLLD